MMRGQGDLDHLRGEARPERSRITITPWSAIARPVTAPASAPAEVTTRLASIHLLPPEERALLLADLDAPERLVLSRVCCGGEPLMRAASELGISYEQAQRIWKQVTARLL